ncbi:AarF/UbiB family protein, partial [Tepidiforma sp.]|uniref:AarF/UbiB family protein n=1 Tax=Tepidiforma sp. TaxID=2682230 RepID=UPI0026376B2E
YNNAKGRPEKKKIIGRKRAYHGVSIAAGHLTALEYTRGGFDLPMLDRFRAVTTPSHYRDGRPGESEEQFATRLAEELDYTREAANQRLFAEHYAGHPFIHVPGVLDRYSTARVLTTELAEGARWDEVVGWPQAERDLAAETMYRFAFGSIYRLGMFNGDPHPGNYLFRRGGRVTFLDFGLVKHFTPDELRPFEEMIVAMVLD